MPLREACGVVGVVGRGAVAGDIFYALRSLQHRGQESAGIATFSHGIHVHRGMGLVTDVFPTPSSVETLSGSVGIGHVRYATAGDSVAENAQPMTASSYMGPLALAHNGEIANAKAIREELEREGWAFITDTDSEIILRLFAAEVNATGDVILAVKRLMHRLSGSYSMVLMVGPRLLVVRDPLGIKPLCFGETAEGGYVAASESAALDTIGARLIRDVRPGETLEFSDAGVSSYMLVQLPHMAHCMFEWVYFARSDSVIDGESVYQVRMRIGKRLAEEHPAQADCVIPVPDSGRAHALGFSRVSGIPYVEGLIKNRFIGRTFILPVQKERERTVHLKLNTVRPEIEGKRVVVVDDSIVRGTTMRRIVAMLRDAGAEQVHVRIGSPPIVAPCYLGIDMNIRSEFVATDRTVEEIARSIGADSLGYISIEGLVASIGKPADDLCTGCLTGFYPVQISGEKWREQADLDRFA